MKHHIYRLQTKGYTFIRQGLSAQRTAELKKGLDIMMEKDDATWGRENLEAMKQRGALRNLCDEAPIFQGLLEDSPIYSILNRLLGDNYILHSFNGLVLFPGDNRFPWDFHSDVSSLDGVAFPANKTPGINCLYYLDNVTEENGATWIIPASHHALLTDPNEEDLASIACQAVGKAGDILLFDVRLWHCAGHNRSEHSRRVIKSQFCLPWYRPEMDYSKAVRPHIMDQLSDHSKRLLGFDSTPPTSVEAFRQAYIEK